MECRITLLDGTDYTCTVEVGGAVGVAKVDLWLVTRTKNDCDDIKQILNADWSEGDYLVLLYIYALVLSSFTTVMYVTDDMVKFLESSVFTQENPLTSTRCLAFCSLKGFWCSRASNVFMATIS